MAALAAVTLAVYSGAAGNGFLSYDDGDYVVGNPAVRDGLTWAGLRWAFTSFAANNWHPLTWLSHMLDVDLFGVWAGGHHLVSVGLHILSALLLFGFLWITTGRRWAGLLAAALFALHPLHVESVAWAAERKDVLSTCLLMATLVAYAWFARKPGARRYLAVAAAFTLGLMAKPMLVSVPIVLLLLDYWPLGRLEPTWASVRARAIEKLPLLALSAASAVLTLAAQGSAIAPLDRVPFDGRLANAAVSYVTYLRQMVWPFGLAIYYGMPASPRFGLAALSAAALIAATAVVARWGSRRRHLVVGWLWYLVTLVPVVGLVQVGEQAHADRYTYIPLVGIFVLAAWAAADLVEARPKLKPVVVIASAALLAGAAVSARAQVGCWRDDMALFGHAVHVGERNRVTLGNLGAALGRRGEVDQGVAVMKQALETAPGDARTLMGIGSLMLQAGRLEESLDYHQRALGADPTLKEALAGMAFTLARLQRAEEGLAYARRAVEANPSWAFGHNVEGMVLANAGRTEESADAFRAAIGIDPREPRFHVNLATVQLRQGDRAGAADELRRALALDPENQAAQAMIAAIEGRQ